MFAYNARSALIELVIPACKQLAGHGVPNTPQARRLMLAIAGQESGFTYRMQLAEGPARGLWQFEKYGGVRGVLEHWATRDIARQVCEEQFVSPNPQDVHRELATNDILAASFARLLLFTDPFAIPETQAAGWIGYLRMWRPGKPRPHHWNQNWFAADVAVTESITGWRKVKLATIGSH